MKRGMKGDVEAVVAVKYSIIYEPQIFLNYNRKWLFLTIFAFSDDILPELAENKVLHVQQWFSIQADATVQTAPWPVMNLL